MGASEIWLDNGGAAPQLIAKVVSDDNPIDDSEQFFDGLTLYDTLERYGWDVLIADAGGV